MKTLSAKAISREYLDVTNGKTDERKKNVSAKKNFSKKKYEWMNKKMCPNGKNHTCRHQKLIITDKARPVHGCWMNEPTNDEVNRKFILKIDKKKNWNSFFFEKRVDFNTLVNALNQFFSAIIVICVQVCLLFSHWHTIAIAFRFFAHDRFKCTLLSWRGPEFDFQNLLTLQKWIDRCKFPSINSNCDDFAVTNTIANYRLICL